MPTIRSAREDEAADIAAVGMRAWASAVAGWVDAELMWENAERAFANFTRNSFLTIDIAEQGGQILAWAARENFDNHITDLWVDPVWQGQGVGRTLLAKQEQETAAQGYDNVRIETHSQNAHAIAFLQRQGYAIRWMTAVWSPQLDRDVDTVGLVKPLEAQEKPSVYAEF